MENFPALIEKSPKILNLKSKDKSLFLYLYGHKLANLEYELQRNLSVTCWNHLIKSCLICEELELNAICSRFRKYYINVKNAHVCYI